jgi:formyltetrahydrofolate hydrolase
MSHTAVLLVDCPDAKGILSTRTITPPVLHARRVRPSRIREKLVLSRAVRWHLQHRILFYGNKTVVFD